MSLSSPFTCPRARLTFRMLDSRGVNVQPGLPSLLTLPTEILLAVFDLLYQEHQANKPKHPKKLVADSCSFPCSVASVCQRFLDVLSLNPRFWRHIVLWVHDPHLYPWVVRRYIAASQEQELAVYISCGSADSGTNDEHRKREHERVLFFAQTVSAHLKRVTTLSIHTHFRSSLLLATGHLASCSAPHLEGLCLTASVTDTSDELTFPAFHSSTVRSVRLDAKGVVDIVTKRPDWPHELEGFWINHVGLDVVPYPPSLAPSGSSIPSLPLLSARAFFHALAHIDNMSGVSLSITGVTLNHDVALEEFDDEDEGGREMYLCNTFSLTLRSLAAPFLALFFRAFKPEWKHRLGIELVDCSFSPVSPLQHDLSHSATLPSSVPDASSSASASTGIPPFEMETNRLTLRSFPSRDDILIALCAWTGNGSLAVEDCLAFDDAMLDLLAVPAAYVPEPEPDEAELTSGPTSDVHTLARDMHYLTIRRCPSVTAGAIRRLVCARNGVLRTVHCAVRPRTKDGFNEELGRSENERTEGLEQDQDVAWLRENLEDFTWE
ncbi:hypothetical protein CONPUDRAFT_144584 [Coniophora puteana RWD-64-598 SS2]|uniref:Uncharacterized protein n=1 Tax=Coniophora puteana (strain RWD-64-598) TaxID=741705 RepID=A0A5M3MN97_CONPW|nr:uncharacterized protein CONPUDRAFT_144584 [Coniophora puteana RWD-64-598 SS2]EIW80527.1 hypothetical protein CONPUDRAFT_144584 [Coniophora puteana RWD-64-598 SS2]